LAVLCATVLGGSLIVAGTNVWLIRSIESSLRTSSAGVTSPSRAHRPVIAVMPKAKGDPYFVSCRAGAEEAARELGVDLIWDGPTSLDAAKQNELGENWITRRVDVSAVAVENRAGMSTVLRKARERGTRVVPAEAVGQAGRADVRVIGLSLPNINKPYVHSGVVQTVVLWNTRDLGYLTVYAGARAAEQTLAASTRTFQAGRLGTIEIRDSQII